jgi:hypothetical protein
MSRPKPRREYWVPTPSMSGQLSTPLLRCEHEGEQEIADIPRQWCSSHSIWRLLETHLNRRLGRSLDGRTDGGWIGWCHPAIELSVWEVGLSQPVDNLVCLGGNTGRVRLNMESLGNRVGTKEHPFCHSIVELFS